MSLPRAARRASRVPATAPDSSCSRPKYRSASPTPAGGRPKYGHSGLATRNTWSDRSEGSCRRIACSSPASSRARIQSELGSEQPPRAAHGGERIRLPTLAVLREAQHDPPPLTQWCLGDAGARLSGDLLNLACLEPCVHEQLLGAESHLLEPVTRDLRRLPVERVRRRGRPATARAPPRTCARRVRVHRTRAAAYRARGVARTARHPPRCSPDSVGSRAGWSRPAPAR